VKRTIGELMEVSGTGRDAEWLADALQSAVELEFATIPVYLSGMWSIEEQTGEVYDLIRSVVLEEMLHMGLACNMLKGIGGTPEITAPVYPGGLPGGVRPGLEVYLAGLSLDSVAMYMEIELPEHPLAEAADDFPTIGAFYDAILAAFEELAPPISTDGQLSSSFSVPDPGRAEAGSVSESFGRLASLTDVQAAIATIKDQGEGTSISPDSPQFGGELAHFYRFGEIFHGHRLVKTPSGQFEFKGDPVPFPACHPVARVPPGGYPDVPESQAFDEQFGDVVANLDDAWGTEGQRALGRAIGGMFSLFDAAQPLIVKPIPGGTGNFGPDFRVPAPPG
jgi:hypothetical protein